LTQSQKFLKKVVFNGVIDQNVWIEFAKKKIVDKNKKCLI
jgi:hypothetical protein